MDLFHLQLFLQTPEEMTPVTYMKGHEIRRVCHVCPTFNLAFKFTVSFISPVFVGGWCFETNKSPPPQTKAQKHGDQTAKPEMNIFWKLTFSSKVGFLFYFHKAYLEDGPPLSK